MPKKKNPYIIFCLETQQRNPELRGKGLPELVVLCNEEWSGMNMDQRAPYIETAKQLDDNPRYQPSFQSRTTIEKTPVEDLTGKGKNSKVISVSRIEKNPVNLMYILFIIVYIQVVLVLHRFDCNL